MRMDQIMGLSEGGKKYLEQHASRDLILTIRNGGLVDKKSQVSKEKSDWDSIVGMNGEDICFHKYLLKDGSWVFEYPQTTIYSSGPMYFLALKLKGGKIVEETLWSETELKDY